MVNNFTVNILQFFRDIQQAFLKYFIRYSEIETEQWTVITTDVFFKNLIRVMRDITFCSKQIFASLGILHSIQISETAVYFNENCGNKKCLKYLL